MTNRSRPIAILASAVGLVLAPIAIAACGGGGATAATPANSTATTTVAPPTSVATGKTALGTILVDSQGRTLYLFTRDSGGASSCTGACAAAWPPLLATGTPTAVSGANAALLGTTKRADGTTQVTYNGHPLYRFVKDANAGETNGQGATAFGGSWFAVTTAGDQAGQRSTSKPSSQPAPAAGAPAPKAKAPAPKPARKAAPEPAPPKPAPEPKAEHPAESSIPQNGGGDGDSDNNGGPSDGDGNV